MRILLVEDEPRIANFVSKGLRENAFAVDVADSTKPVATASQLR